MIRRNGEKARSAGILGELPAKHVGEEPRQGFVAHLFHEPRAAGLDGFVADAEGGSDGLVGLSLNDEIEHLPFAGTEGVEAVGGLPVEGALGVTAEIERQGGLDGIEQELVAGGFLDEIDDAGFHGGDGDGHIRMGREDENGHLNGA